MLMRRLRVAVSLFAMLMGGRGMLLGPVMLADFVVVGRLMVMMSGGAVTSRRVVMVRSRRVFAFICHN
jgi:hypothetical protein